MTESAPPKSSRALAREPSSLVKEQAPVGPTLQAYYEQERPVPAAWFRALKDAKVVFFPTADIEGALRDLDVLDGSLQKTVLLAEVMNAPTAVQRWLAQVVDTLLGQTLGETFSGQPTDARRLSRLIARSRLNLKDKDRALRKRSENLLRLVVAHHLGQGGRLLEATLSSLRNLTSEGEGEVAPVSGAEIERWLRKASPSQLAGAGRVWSYAEALAAEVRSERDRLRIHNGRLEGARTELIEAVKREGDSRADAEERVSMLRKQLEEVERTHEARMQVVRHQDAAVRDRERNFLESKLRTLLEDALAGLDVARDDSAQAELGIGVASDRLNQVLRILEEEARWLRSSA